MAYDISGATDRISVPYTTLGTIRSYSIWTYRDSDGGGSAGRVWQKGTSAGATISPTHLTSAINRSVTSSYATASISPGSNRLILAWICTGQRNSDASAPPAPTLSGNGLTWVQVATVTHSGGDFQSQRLTLFRAMGASPSSGAVTISLGGVSVVSASWSIVEFDGVDTGGTNGSAAVVQSATNVTGPTNGGTLTVTLGSFSSASNATAGGFGDYGALVDPDITPGSGFTQLGEGTGLLGKNSKVMSEWKSSNDTSVDADFTGSFFTTKTGIAVEIKAGSGGAAPDALYVDSTKMYFQRKWSTAGGLWSISKPSASTWHNITITYDGSSSSNNPIIYVDGSSQTVTTETAPSGSIDNSDTSAYLLGNRDAFDANWDGRQAEFAIWDRILLAGEAFSLSKMFSPIIIRPLVYASLVRDAISNAGALTVTGATVITHPPMLYPG